MYSKEKGIGVNWFDIIAKVLFLIVFILILMWFFPKVPNMSAFYSNVFRENISYMQNAAKSYYTVERMPKNTGDTSSMTLQDMINKNLILPFVDKDGNSCDTNGSYVQVTKQDTEYSLKVNLVCNNEQHYIIETIGCYNFDICENCTAEEAKATATKTGTTSGTATKTNWVQRVVNTVAETVAPAANNTITQTNTNTTTTSKPAETPVVNNNQNNAAIVNGSNNTITQTNTNTTKIYNDYTEKETTKKTTTETETYTYTSIPWVNDAVSYKSTTLNLKVPSDLDRSNISNVRISDVRYSSKVSSSSQIRDYRNNRDNWYNYTSNGYDYPSNYWTTYYLARSMSGINFNYSGMNITWSENYSCGNTAIMSGTYKTGGTWSQDTCMTGVIYKVTFKYEITK